MRKREISHPVDRGGYASAPERLVTVLAVSGSQEDHNWLGEIIRHSNWKLLSARSCREACEILKSDCVPVVVCESSLPDGNWRSLLDRLAQSAGHPLLIVTSRQADDHLWAEVLNLGGYDVLPKPFDSSEVVRVIGSAWLHWRHRGMAQAAWHVEAAMAYGATA